VPLAIRFPLGLVAALMLSALADEWLGFFPSGVFESVRRDLRLGYGHVSLILVMPAVGGILGLAVTVAADHVSRRLLASVGAFAYAASLLAFGGGESVWVLAAAGFVMGLASDALVHGTEVALVDLAGEDELGPTLARTEVLGSVGDVLGPATLALAAAAGISWRIPFVGAAAIMAGYGLWLAALPLPAPSNGTDGPRPLAGVRSVLRDARVLEIGAFVGLLSLLDEDFLAFVIAFLRQERGHSETLAVAVATVAVSGGILGFALMATRMGRRPVRIRLTGAAVCLLAGTLLVPVAPTVGLQALGAFTVMAGLAAAWVTIETVFLTIRPGLAGTVSAVVSLLALPAAAVPLLVGALADRLGLPAALWLFVGVAAAILLWVRLGRLGAPMRSGAPAGRIEMTAHRGGRDTDQTTGAGVSGWESRVEP
jgi:MFS family permease